MRRILRWTLVAFALLLVVLAALPWLRSEERADLDAAARATAPGRFIALRHGQVHYRLDGPARGEPVVLVHGFSVPSYVFDGTREALAAAGFRVLSFDLYGRGFSDRPDVVHDRDLFADQLDELMTQLHIPRAKVVALSMGGAVAGRFTARHPERVERLVLIAPLTQAQDISVLATPGLGEWVFGAYWLPKLRDSQLDDFKHPERFPNWTSRFAEQMQYRGFGRALLSTGRNLATQPSLPDFATVGRSDLPVLLVWGREDHTVPFADSVAVMKAIPKARLLAVDGVGHLPHLEAPQIVNPAIVEFLHAGAATPAAKRDPLSGCEWVPFVASRLGVRMRVQRCTAPESHYEFSAVGNAIEQHRPADDRIFGPHRVIELYDKPATQPIEEAIAARFIATLPEPARSSCKVEALAASTPPAGRRRYTLVPTGAYARSVHAELQQGPRDFGCGPHGKDQATTWFEFQPATPTRYAWVAYGWDEPLFDADSLELSAPK